MLHANSQAKNTSFKLSDQVQQLLSERGFSAIFNWSDYKHFQRQANNAWNKAQTIAELFISETNSNSDFDGYVF